MSIEIVDDLHDLMVQNKKLKKEIDYLRNDMALALSKLKGFRVDLELCIECLQPDSHK